MCFENEKDVYFSLKKEVVVSDARRNFNLCRLIKAFVEPNLFQLSREPYSASVRNVSLSLKPSAHQVKISAKWEEC